MDERGIVEETAEFIAYSRCKFSTRLPQTHLYTASHFWLARQSQPGLWRVGFTKFAARMLGEMVECGFSVKPGARVTVGEVVGSFEGFKAVTDLYCVAEGVFVRENVELQNHGSWVRTDPYGKGWLYEVNGAPEPNKVDARGYVGILNATIDRMQEP
jgi:glycine cleavage system H protein